MNLNNFFHKSSKRLLSYEEPLEYLKNRGLTLEDIDKYKIGYSKVINIANDGSEEYKEFKKDTFDFKILQSRVLFPLHNLIGNINGVVARDIHHKRYMQVLLREAKSIGAFFGVNEAFPHILRTRKVFVHEGAIDCISFSKVFPNSVSSLTSFLNTQQYETLKMIADKIILVFDGDFSGSHGIRKSLKTYGSGSIESLNIGAEDSNYYLQMFGVERFARYIKTKVPFMLQN